VALEGRRELEIRHTCNLGGRNGERSRNSSKNLLRVSQNQQTLKLPVVVL
jgi:hypothetical protein